MVVNFSNVDMNERPTLILKNAGGTPLGTLGFAKNVSLELKYNEVSTLEFELPAYADGVSVPFYDEVIGMRIIEVRGIGQFILTKPKEVGDGIKRIKTCIGNSLEYEFVYKKISIPNGTYKFYGGSSGEDTILGMILELMPSWHVGKISSGILNKYRTFEETNENVYNFIKGSVQESFNCIFDFDTIDRLINIRDVNEEPQHKPVYISTDNLAKEIEIEENTEDIVTRLDVNGADGVNIRDVNPTGTNKLIMLDYFMTTSNFTQSLIDKYYAWKELCNNNRRSYYNLSIQYSLGIMQKVTEQAKLADLQGEMTGLENVQSVTIQAIAQGLETQAALNTANANIRAKQREIDAKNEEIDAIEKDIDDIYTQLMAIRDACSYEAYFNDDERIQLDRYMKDGEVSESSFVASTVDTYNSDGAGGALREIALSASDAEIERITDAAGNVVYDVRGGSLTIGNVLNGNIISSVWKRKSGNKFVATAYLGSGEASGNPFPTACVSVSGIYGGFSESISDGNLSCNVTGYMYFTLDASEYEQRSISWELYEFGLDVIQRLAYPTYTFSVDSANFFAIEDFTAFKNHIELGQKVYTELKEDQVLEPICIGVKLSFGDLKILELQFSDSYVSGDSAFRLVDLLNKSVSMGKNVDLSRYIYSSFVDSGASTGIKDFMTSALDTAKNAILSSTEQAISWDGAGLRLRRYANEAHTAYEPEQIWMSNNSIVMTDDAWATAKMAIGKFHDENAGDCWGIVAPMIVGTILAGERLVIESVKRDGGTAVFRVDGDGCQLYNTDFTISKTKNGVTTQIALNPDVGIAIGKYPLYNTDSDGNKTLNETNANFWADDDGNLHLRGAITATSLYINNKTIKEYVDTEANSVAVSVTNDKLKNYYTKTESEQNFSITYEKVSSLISGTYALKTDVDAAVEDLPTMIQMQTYVEQTEEHFLTEAQKSTSTQLKDYLKTENFSSAVTQNADSIVSTVTSSTTYKTNLNDKADKSALNDYVKTTEFSSKIQQNSDSIVAMVTESGNFYTKQAKVEITSDGITMTGGNIQISAGANFIVSSGGAVKINAGNGVDSYITLGGNSPTFSVTNAGGLVAQAGSFSSLKVGGKAVLTEDNLPYRIVISSTQPSGGGIIWAKPASVTNITYTGATGSSRSTEWNVHHGVTTTLSADTSDTFSGGTITYKIAIPIYQVNGSENNIKFTIKLTKGGTSVTFPVYTTSTSSWTESTIETSISTTTNLCSTTGAITLTISTSGQSTYNLFVQSNRTITLTCSTSSTAGVQQLEMYYIK